MLDIYSGKTTPVFTSAKCTDTATNTYGGDQYLDPNWAPDNQNIVVSVNRWCERNFVSDFDIYTATRSGSDLSPLVAWPGNQYGGDYSADGTKFVFSSDTDPDGNPLASEQVYLIDPTSSPDSSAQDLGDGSEPAISPDGTKVALDGVGGIYGENAGGSGTRVKVSGSGSWGPDWSTDGTRIAWNDGSPTSIDTAAPDGSAPTTLEVGSSTGQFTNAAYRQASQSSGYIDYLARLTKFAPYMRYDSQETFFADSAAEITDNYVHAKKTQYTNALHSGFDDSTIATADPNLGFPRLALGFLGANYGSGTSANSSDYIDAANSYGTDYQRMTSQAGSPYPNHYYGRVAEDPDGSMWLQYWFFEYDNPQSFLGIGTHEGDWEGISIQLDGSGNPVFATYNRHDTAQTCSWGQVEQALAPDGNLHPTVFVANASHASYFTPGTHNRPWPEPNDQADGLGRRVLPSLEEVTGYGPSWITWPGRWGGTKSDGTPGSADSPSGPAIHRTGWSSPDTWASSQDQCVTIATHRRAFHALRKLAPRPRPPRIVARRHGRAVSVWFRVRKGALRKQLRPYSLLLTVHARGWRYAPSSRGVRLKKARGRVSIRLPIGRGPYRVLASVWSKRGYRSKIVTVHLP